MNCEIVVLICELFGDFFFPCSVRKSVRVQIPSTAFGMYYVGWGKWRDVKTEQISLQERTTR